MFLLDTNVVSELRKPKPHGGVVAWFSEQDAQSLFISAMTVGELQRGVEMTREQDAGKAVQIEKWIDQLVFTGQIVPIDASICREWARLMHRCPAALAEDAFIAATARIRRLAVVTRNVRDFRTFEVETLNPFERIGNSKH